MEPKDQSVVVEMSCREVRRRIVDYLDGEMDLDAFVRIDAHLDHCAHCSAIYQGVRNVVTLLGSEEVFPMPPELDERIHTEVARVCDES